VILDTLAHSHFYAGIGQRFARAFAWLHAADLSKLEPQTIELEGRDLYVLVQEYQAKTDVAWESHRDYADIQYVVSGNESILYADVGQKDRGDYNEVKDRYVPDVEADMNIDLGPGQFAIFFPQDAHKPGLVPARTGIAATVRKIVVKVRL
jgi:YhcH/YjgK/YiaL family protein